jgi:hypothetical protein
MNRETDKERPYEIYSQLEDDEWWIHEGSHKTLADAVVQAHRMNNHPENPRDILCLARHPYEPKAKESEMLANRSYGFFVYDVERMWGQHIRNFRTSSNPRGLKDAISDYLDAHPNDAEDIERCKVFDWKKFWKKNEKKKALTRLRL